MALGDLAHPLHVDVNTREQTLRLFAGAAQHAAGIGPATGIAVLGHLAEAMGEHGDRRVLANFVVGGDSLRFAVDP